MAENYSYTYNSSQYQSYDSKECLYFVYHRYHGLSYYEIVKKFSLVDLDCNPKVIVDFFNNYN